MGQNLSYIVRKDTKQLIFNWGQMQFFIVQPDTAGSKINFQRAIYKTELLTSPDACKFSRLCVTRRRARSSSTEKGFVR